jgi:hypothetical protein
VIAGVLAAKIPTFLLPDISLALPLAQTYRGNLYESSKSFPGGVEELRKGSSWLGLELSIAWIHVTPVTIWITYLYYRETSEGITTR